MSDTAQIITALLGTNGTLVAAIIWLVKDIIARQDRQIESQQTSLQTSVDNIGAALTATQTVVESVNTMIQAVNTVVQQMHQENRTSLGKIENQLTELRLDLRG